MEGLTEKIRGIMNKLDIKSPPVPIEKIADLFSIRVVPFSGFPDNISGTITKQKDVIFIGVNDKHSATRQRFTIAHELGHFLLNHEMGDQIIDDVFDRPTDKEREANNFAAELLKPKDFLKQDIGKKLKIPDLARRYNVSEQALSIRLLKTGLINNL
ncbi:MAG: ImmA/IrrE family metallo-endopeptidase [Patescibacteria group bacterium]